MKTVPVSLICTVLDEEDTIDDFLNSVFSMSLLPDELIVVDGGSTDKTVERIQLFQKSNTSIKLFIEQGCNIAKGRNIAIHHAQFDYIAITDAGCRVDKQWLEQLIEPFLHDSTVDIVGGWVESDPHTPFEEWISLLQKPFEAIDFGKYHATARSLAVRKDCWEAVGGFPEDLSMWAEDTVFFLRLKAKGFRIIITPHAIVRWRPRRNIREFWLQYLNYGIGDGEAGIYPKLFLKRCGLFASVILLAGGFIISYIISVICFIVLGGAFMRLMMPLKRVSLAWWKLFPLFALTLVMETAQVFGYCIGWTRRKKLFS